MISAVLDKDISKKIEHGWEIPLTIRSLQNKRNAGVVPLTFAEQLSISEKGDAISNNV